MSTAAPIASVDSAPLQVHQIEPRFACEAFSPVARSRKQMKQAPSGIPRAERSR